MDDLIKDLAEKHPKLQIEKKVVEIDDEKHESCIISGLPGNDNLKLILQQAEDFTIIKEFLSADSTILQELVGCKIGQDIHITLSPVGHFSFINWWKLNTGKTSFQIQSHYFGNSLNISITRQKKDDYLPFIAEHAQQVLWSRNHVVAIIKGLNHPTDIGIEMDVKNILSSILFDIAFTYGIGLGTLSFDSFEVRRLPRYHKYPVPPGEPFNIVYKSYVPELLEYYNIGIKVDYLPFQYLCFFHVLEYFSDKSAYQVVSQNVRNMMLYPDFHEKIDYYVNTIIQLVKKESERNLNDKIKVTRVLRQFILSTEVNRYLEEKKLLKHFTSDCKMQCSKPLILSALDFSTERKFIDTLAVRIYSLRCSIVHSNPEFENSKAIPFVPTAANLKLLRMEIEILAEVARTIIVKSARN